jgi:hypothetical protein
MKKYIMSGSLAFIILICTSGYAKTIIKCPVVQQKVKYAETLKGYWWVWIQQDPDAPLQIDTTKDSSYKARVYHEDAEGGIQLSCEGHGMSSQGSRVLFHLLHSTHHKQCKAENQSYVCEK